MGPALKSASRRPFSGSVSFSADVGGDKVIVRMPSQAARYVRSTLLCSGVAELRTRGHLDRYLAHLPKEAADVLIPGVAATWLPIEIADAHYAACDRIGLNPEECFAIGQSSGTRLQHSVLQTFARLAQGAGANPLTLFQSYGRLWNRNFEGGGVTITRAGPKDVILEARDFPLPRYAYFRHGYRGMNEIGLRLFARTVYVREIGHTPTSLSLKISWV